jgi:hypothetical protein
LERWFWTQYPTLFSLLETDMVIILDSHFNQPIFALEKSISGCCSWNFFRISSFFCSSLVGLPDSFWRWSNIIFSTMPLVSPSKSLSLLFSGWILEVSILGAEVMTCGHHSSWLTLSRWMAISFSEEVVEVSVQVDSSTRTAWGRSPYKNIC